MLQVRFRTVLAVVAGCTLSASALAQPINYENVPNAGQVNISGATLFKPFFEAPASTNDFIDVDGDGFFGYDPNTFPFVDQLAPTFVPGNPLTTVWAVQYRGVGSVNGLEEFINSTLCDYFSQGVPAENGYLNRFAWAIGGVRQLGSWPDWLSDVGDPNWIGWGIAAPDGNFANDPGTPLPPEKIDIAILDVPSIWGLVAGDPANADWFRGPGTDGYGQCPILSNTGWSNQMESLTRDCNGGTVSIDPNEIVDTTVAWAAITYIANRGVARPDLNGDGVAGDINLSDIQHLFLTGRSRSGENLAVGTRSGGSGTRNGMMNTSGIDPSWGRGDNLDSEWANTNSANVGPNRRISNAEGSSGVERAVQVSRLGIAYTGLFGNERAAFDANAGRYEILNIARDTQGGTNYVRPSVNAVINNCDVNTGWQLGGQVTFVTVCDPQQTDPNAPDYCDNQAAATYLDNILESIANVEGAPTSPENFNMPGEYLATRFVLEAAIDCVPTFNNPSVFVPNPLLNQALQDYTLVAQTTVVPAYGSKNPAGLVPRRVTLSEDPTLDPNVPWLDGTPVTDNTYRYKGTGGAFFTIARDKKLGSRNAVTGDFNRDGLRNVDDVEKMMVAYAAPLDFEQDLGPAPGDAGEQTGGNYPIVHIMADFNSDGNFTAKDVRYFADGLALDPAYPNGTYGPVLNRKLAFQRVDTFWALQPGGDGNFFDTTLATPKAYAAGDSEGDVAGNPTVPGADPRGADGVVNAADIDYVYAQFKNERFGWNNAAANWFDIDQAIYFDLSADMTGPETVLDTVQLVVNQADVDYLVQVILGTDYGDANLDGAVDATDKAIVEANLGQPGGWADGNFDGDETVDADDLALFQTACVGDTNCDGVVGFGDINPFVAGLTGGPQCNPANFDINGNGTIGFDDINPFVALLSSGGGPCP